MTDGVKETFVTVFIDGLKRMSFDLAMWIGLMVFFVFMSGTDILPQAVNLLMFKAVCVSMGFLHAHIMRKLAFPKVDWEAEDKTGHKALVIALYVVVIFAYSRGG